MISIKYLVFILAGSLMLLGGARTPLKHEVFLLRPRTTKCVTDKPGLSHLEAP